MNYSKASLLLLALAGSMSFAAADIGQQDATRSEGKHGMKYMTAEQKAKMHQAFQHMTPEQRAKIVDALQKRISFWQEKLSTATAKQKKRIQHRIMKLKMRIAKIKEGEKEAVAPQEIKPVEPVEPQLVLSTDLGEPATK